VHAPAMREVKAFVPSKDHAVSLAFYEAMGWRCAFRGEGVAVMVSEAGRFLLQDFYEPSWADNFMLHVDVDDAVAWAGHAQAVLDTGRFPGAAFRGTRVEPYGAIVTYVMDPSGVLLHFAQPVSPGDR